MGNIQLDIFDGGIGFEQVDQISSIYEQISLFNLCGRGKIEIGDSDFFPVMSYRWTKGKWFSIRHKRSLQGESGFREAVFHNIQFKKKDVNKYWKLISQRYIPF